MTRLAVFLILICGLAGAARAADDKPTLLAQAAQEQPPAEAEAPAETEAPAEAEAVAGPRHYFIQLASLNSREAAEREWGNLRKAHRALLDGMALALQPVDLGDRGVFHRVQVGPLPNRATARDLCWQLRAREQDCVVIRR